MQNEYKPKFPRSVSGYQYRLPLDHPEIESLGRRASAAYTSFPLTDAERAALIKSYDGLKKADFRSDIDLAIRIGGQSRVRPSDPCVRRLEDVATDITDAERVAGFIERVRAFIEALERKYRQQMLTASVQAYEL